MAKLANMNVIEFTMLLTKTSTIYEAKPYVLSKSAYPFCLP